MFGLKGKDAFSWLQSQITQDMEKINPGIPVETLLCSPTGQVVAQASIMRYYDDLLIFTDQFEVFKSRLQEYVVTEDVELFYISDRALKNDWTLLPIIEFQDSKSSLYYLEAFEEDDDTDLSEEERFFAGYPIVGEDTTPKTLPLELHPLYYKAAVSTTKGCYMGQEVIQRMETRGHANWQWVALEGLTEPPVFASGERATIQFMRFVLSGLASAYVLTELAVEGKEIQAGDQTATVRLFPLRDRIELEDED